MRVPTFTGAFKANCSGWVFTRNGEIVFGASSRDLDQLIVREEGDNVVVGLERVRLGDCRDERAKDCSMPPGETIVDGLPPALIADWGAMGSARSQP